MRTVWTPSMRSDNSLHATSTPWPCSQSRVRTPWERGGMPWALLGNVTVAVGAPWHLHVKENVKLFPIFSSIFMRSHGALRNFKLPCQCHGVAIECDRALIHGTKMTKKNRIPLEKLKVCCRVSLVQNKYLMWQKAYSNKSNPLFLKKVRCPISPTIFHQNSNSMGIGKLVLV